MPQLVQQPGILDGDDSLAREVRDQRDLLVGERADLAAIDGDHTNHLVPLEHWNVDYCPDAAKFDRGNDRCVAVVVGLLRTQVSDVDWLPGLGGAGHGACRERPDHTSAPLRSECRRHRTVERNGAEGLSFAEPKSAVAGLAEPRRIREDGLKYGPKFAWRTADDAQHLGSRGLLLQRFP